jgi:hypothetical protein
MADPIKLVRAPRVSAAQPTKTATMTATDTSNEVSRRRLRLEIAKISTVVRQCSCLTAAAVALLAPAVPGITNAMLMLGLAAWAVYRLATRSQSAVAIAGDVGWMVAMGAAATVSTAGPDLSEAISAPQVIVAVSIATLGVQLRVPWSTAVLTAGCGAYAWGTATTVGWDHALSSVYPIVGGWTVAVLLRLAIENVARTADRVHRDHLAAQITNGIADARRKADREQLAMLHDTAAATLLLVTQASPVPVERLAAQAARDLEVLQARPAEQTSAPVDVIELLRRDVTAYVDLPIEFTGLDHLWLHPDLAQVICAASREALNNVDRHASARSVTIYASWHRLEICDDGRGFTFTPSHRHGIRESIVARMRGAGGDAHIHSVPGSGTTVELRWFSDLEDLVSAEVGDDADELTRNLRSWYRLALITAGILLLTFRVWSSPMGPYPVQIGLAAAAALCALAGAPRVLHNARCTVWVAAAVLVALSVVQNGLLAVTELGTSADWSLGMIGFCLLPLLLRLPPRRALAILLAVLAIPAAIDLVRDSSPHTMVYLGLAVSAFLIPQISAILFGVSVRSAVRHARGVNAARVRLETKDAIAAAMQSECIRGYSDTVDRLVPLLHTLAHGGPITEETRRRARAECRRLRTLFDQSGPEATPLSHRIELLIGKAEQRGVSVTAHLDGDLPKLNVDIAEDVLGHVDAALEQARSWARIILTSAQAEVDLSVVCDLSKTPSTASPSPPGGAEVVVAEDTMWLTLRAG